MGKPRPNAGQVLNALGKLTSYLKSMDQNSSEFGEDKTAWFNYPLKIISETLHFNVSVLYRVSNIINNRLILEVIKVVDPGLMRIDLQEGRKVRLFLDARDKRYVNEVHAVLNKKTSHIKVKGLGCDMIGYVYLPDNFGGIYLVGGDCTGKCRSIQDFEISAMEIMCSLLSTIIMKTMFEQKAEYDDLTGLYNSGRIKEEVEKIILRFKRRPYGSAVLAMGDIDFFKSVNDNYGHIQGDLVLKEVGRIISNSMRECFDFAGRYGGEEFLIIFEDSDIQGGFEAVERIRHVIEKYDFPRIERNGTPVENKTMNVTMSFGISLLTGMQTPVTPKAWIAKADHALYQSKHNGRNQTTIYQENPGIK
ncbi:GGDEF domain-containing protein [uncultured Desulfobacter sp.]|uniref:GGDEF domain-containing protein n=1 Tax=uncultured Desulfobacter sp. TaxID=240139 RepID=UPI002AAC2D9E|nr:GGDEF domain-containing protein [uncultured Desulfobacter sp.]